MRLYLPLVPCNGIQDSLGLWIQHRGFRILGTGFWILRQWNLDSGFQSGFLKLYRGFQSPGFRIPQDKLPGFWIPQAKISRIPESGFPYTGRSIYLCSHVFTMFSPCIKLCFGALLYGAYLSCVVTRRIMILITIRTLRAKYLNEV